MGREKLSDRDCQIEKEDIAEKKLLLQWKTMNKAIPLRLKSTQNTVKSKCIEVVFSGGFFLACDNFGRIFGHSFPAFAFFFFKVEISSRIPISLFRPGSVHSGSAS